MVPACGHRLRPIWAHIFFPDVQPGGKARRVRLLASHQLALYRFIRMALFFRDVFRHKFSRCPGAYPHCDRVHAALSGSFVCSPASIFPSPTNVPIPNILIFSSVGQDQHGHGARAGGYFHHPRPVACRPQTPMVRWEPFTRQTTGERMMVVGLVDIPSRRDKDSSEFHSPEHRVTILRRGARAAESA